MVTNWDGKMSHINGVLLKNVRVRCAMRGSFVYVLICGMLLPSILPIMTNVIAEDVPLGNTITISGEETWSGNQAIGGLVEITSTGNLIIDSANIEMEVDSSIIIRMRPKFKKVTRRQSSNTSLKCMYQSLIPWL